MNFVEFLAAVFHRQVTTVIYMVARLLQVSAISCKLPAAWLQGHKEVQGCEGHMLQVSQGSV